MLHVDIPDAAHRMTHNSDRLRMLHVNIPDAAHRMTHSSDRLLRAEGGPTTPSAAASASAPPREEGEESTAAASGWAAVLGSFLFVVVTQRVKTEEFVRVAWPGLASPAHTLSHPLFFHTGKRSMQGGMLLKALLLLAAVWSASSCSSSDLKACRGKAACEAAGGKFVESEMYKGVMRCCGASSQGFCINKDLCEGAGGKWQQHRTYKNNVCCGASAVESCQDTDSCQQYNGVWAGTAFGCKVKGACEADGGKFLNNVGCCKPAKGGGYGIGQSLCKTKDLCEWSGGTINEKKHLDGTRSPHCCGRGDIDSCASEENCGKYDGVWGEYGCVFRPPNNKGPEFCYLNSADSCTGTPHVFERISCDLSATGVFLEKVKLPTFYSPLAGKPFPEAFTVVNKIWSPRQRPQSLVGSSDDVAIADLNGDGRLDVVGVGSGAVTYILTAPMPPKNSVWQPGTLGPITGGGDAVKLFEQDPYGTGQFLNHKTDSLTAQAYKAGGGAPELFATIDADSSGNVTYAELRAAKAACEKAGGDWFDLAEKMTNGFPDYLPRGPWCLAPVWASSVSIKIELAADEGSKAVQIADVNMDGLKDIVVLVGKENKKGGSWGKQTFDIMRDGLEDARPDARLQPPPPPCP